MNLGMTKIYKFQDDISTDALKELEKHSSLATVSYTHLTLPTNREV